MVITKELTIENKVFLETLLEVKVKKDFTMSDHENNLFLIKKGTISHRIESVNVYFFDENKIERKINFSYFGKNKNKIFFKYEVDKLLIELLKKLYEKFPNKYFLVEKGRRKLFLDAKPIVSVNINRLNSENINFFVRKIKNEAKTIIKGNKK